MIPQKTVKKQSGFTLIEVALVIGLIGFAVAAGTISYTHFANNQKARVTEERMDKILNAISVYAQKNYRVPCGADPAAGTAGAIDPSSTLADQGREPNNGRCFNRSATVDNSIEAMGVVPWKELGLTEQDVKDGWDRYFTYKPAPHLTLNNKSEEMMEATNQTANDVHDACRGAGWFNSKGEHVNRAKALFCCNAEPKPEYLTQLGADNADSNDTSGWNESVSAPTANMGTLTSVQSAGWIGQDTNGDNVAVTSSNRWIEDSTSGRTGDFNDAMTENNGRGQSTLNRASGIAVSLISHGANGKFALIEGRPKNSRNRGTFDPNTGALLTNDSGAANLEIFNALQATAGTIQNPKTAINNTKGGGTLIDATGQKDNASDDLTIVMRTDQLMAKVGGDTCLKMANLDPGSIAPQAVCPSFQIIERATGSLKTVTLTQGQSLPIFAASSVPFPSTCTATYIRCENGALVNSTSGTPPYSAFGPTTAYFDDCSAGIGADCNNICGRDYVHADTNIALRDGGGSNIVARCYNGNLHPNSDTANPPISAVINPATLQCTNQSCSNPCGGTIAHGGSATFYQSSVGDCSVTQSRNCNNSVLSGTYAYCSCTNAPTPPTDPTDPPPIPEFTSDWEFIDWGMIDDAGTTSSGREYQFNEASRNLINTGTSTPANSTLFSVSNPTSARWQDKIRIDFQQSQNCFPGPRSGSNDTRPFPNKQPIARQNNNTQRGNAVATIRTGLAVDLFVKWKGCAETQDGVLSRAYFEHMGIYINTDRNSLFDPASRMSFSVSTGGYNNNACGGAPITPIDDNATVTAGRNKLLNCSPANVEAAAQNNIIKIGTLAANTTYYLGVASTTADPLFHVNAWYEFELLYGSPSGTPIDPPPPCTTCGGGGEGGGSGGGCFVATTKILMADGLEKNIKNIKVGDMVMAYNKDSENAPLEPKRVSHVFETGTKETYNLNGTKVTGTHKYKTTKGMVAVADLKIGDILIKSDGTETPITIHEKSTLEPVYNITVEDYHSYIANGHRVGNMNFAKPIAEGYYTAKEMHILKASSSGDGRFTLK